MPQDPRVDAYIAKAAPFAQPILEHLRSLIHRACPDTEEAIKWSMPMFLYRGKIIVNIAAFKAHAAFGTWKREVGDSIDRPEATMGRLGRLTRLADLPPDDEIVAAVRCAMAAVDAGGTSTRRVSSPKPAPDVPDDLQAALDAVPAAATAFAAFPPGARRDYTDWVIEAKQAATRARRIAQAVEWCAEGKRRHWKHEAC
ncbi:YdeI/OmpD-associated family protein [Sphingosinicellaceae bacterium]|nr:YdeI/OmpD-associated family protein [Sphingosinicellaceae bacterium]